MLTRDIGMEKISLYAGGVKGTTIEEFLNSEDIKRAKEYIIEAVKEE